MTAEGSAWIEIEYEDGRTVRYDNVPDQSLLHSAKWMDWLIRQGDAPMAAEE